MRSWFGLPGLVRGDDVEAGCQALGISELDLVNGISIAEREGGARPSVAGADPVEVREARWGPVAGVGERRAAPVRLTSRGQTSPR